VNSLQPQADNLDLLINWLSIAHMSGGIKWEITLYVHCLLLQPWWDRLLSYLVLHTTPIMMVVSATASALRGNTVFTELNLNQCFIDAEGTSQLAEALCGITTLRVLNLSWNPVDTQGARHLGKWSCLSCAYFCPPSRNMTGYDLTQGAHCHLNYLEWSRT